MKFNIPDTAFIYGILHAIEVRKFTDDEDDCTGLYDPVDRSLHISEALHKHLRREVFCHEYTEGVNSALDLGLKHYQICAIGVAFHDLINQLEAE